MSEEIVRRLRNRNFRSLNAIKESLNTSSLREADEDDEDDLDIDAGMEDDTPETDIETEDEEEIEAPPEEPREYHSSSPSIPSSPESPEETEEEEGESDPKIELEKPSQKNVNPLDNQYAVNFKLGDRVSLSYSNGTSTDVNASVEGYDKEGFYRIKLDNGLMINGLTDLALSELVASTNENVCICGGNHFVTEGKFVVCDDCGRRIRESMDNLTLLDKKRSSGKKMIRSIPHPMSTATKPNISDAVGESIRKAFKGKSITESDDEDEEYEDDEDSLDLSRYEKLINNLEGEFWTRLPELQEDIEDLGYTVYTCNHEYVEVSTADPDDDDILVIPVTGTSRTITLDFSKVEIV